ncbi:GntR family transcriptional regulator [Actinocrispum wychmicini]|uniref:DNA-binding GntR family transcriptional regulator n=1 Tax=Actinocrispum wychmicini TaxID=1213861 RepID=A0A4V2S626_9PSEU|nr:GntR family transcriptional regulator [Actinocrispum wychmicini]TCO54170.1 DNA-binding GntR family transcriptional regulator [Actinocrispum wychmicini]
MDHEPPDSSYQLLVAAAARDAPTRPSSGSRLLRDHVYARVLEWIVDGRLPPGTRMRDKDIADLLEVSRTPVREAIRRLEDEGLVTTEASRWTRVAELNVAAAEQIYPIRWTLEGLAISLGGPWPADRIAELKAANKRLAKAVRAGDAAAAAKADSDFHDVIIAIADNTWLTSIVGDLTVHLRRLEVAYFAGGTTANQSVHEHKRAISALAKGDLGAAESAITENWQRSLDRIRRHNT